MDDDDFGVDRGVGGLAGCRELRVGQVGVGRRGPAAQIGRRARPEQPLVARPALLASRGTSRPLPLGTWLLGLLGRARRLRLLGRAWHLGLPLLLWRNLHLLRLLLRRHLHLLRHCHLLLRHGRRSWHPGLKVHIVRQVLPLHVPRCACAPATKIRGGAGRTLPPVPLASPKDASRGAAWATQDRPWGSLTWGQLKSNVSGPHLGVSLSAHDMHMHMIQCARALLS